MASHIPDGFELARTTPTFTNTSVPAGLLAAHKVADDVWGKLLVFTGTLRFVFEDDPDHPLVVGPGDHVVIPPSRLHHLELGEAVTFAVEFHRDQATNR